jgi:hypothetical protein
VKFSVLGRFPSLQVPYDCCYGYALSSFSALQTHSISLIQQAVVGPAFRLVPCLPSAITDRPRLLASRVKWPNSGGNSSHQHTPTRFGGEYSNTRVGFVLPASSPVEGPKLRVGTGNSTWAPLYPIGHYTIWFGEVWLSSRAGKRNRIPLNVLSGHKERVTERE